MGKKKHETKEKEEDVDEIDLQSIIDLGGTKKDLELLNTIADENEEIDDFEVEDSEPIKKDDIRQFIQELGINKIMDFTEESSDTEQKGTKLLSRPMDEEERKEFDEKQKNLGKKKNKNKFKVQDEEISSTVPSVQPATYNIDFINTDPKHRKYLLIKSGRKWHEQLVSTDPAVFEPVDEETSKKFESFACKLYENEIRLYQTQQENKRSSSSSWMKTVLQSGTVSDKMAALTLQVQESPVYNLKSLDTILGMCSKKGKREALQSMDTLKELFLNELLLGRKLKPLDQHPLMQLEELSSGNHDSRDRRLILWYFEAKLKERFAQFVNSIEAISHDTVIAAKKKSIVATFDLLVNNPEQEKVLLSNLVNKLGDPEHKVASKSAHLLKCVVDKHPNMKMVIVLDVERLLYRPNVAGKAQYYGVCFLNQLILSKREQELASRLIDIYFSFFKIYVKQGEVDSKMLSGLLTGVNRAYPYAKVNTEKIEESMSTLYRIVHIVNFNTSIQALMLLYQVMDSSENISDRYYTALYRKLLDPDLHSSSKQAMFLNLLFKSLKKDLVSKRIKAFIKRLLQVCCHQTPTFICGALVLLSEVLKENKDLLSLSKAAAGSDDEEEHFVDAEDEDDDDSKNESDVKPPAARDTVGPSWIHRKNIGVKSDSGDYDPAHRNPLYCQAEIECVWELKRLCFHYHPTVALFASTIIKGQSVKYDGDPLQDFTLMRFLDRFVYRNPKKKNEDGDNKSMGMKAYNPSGLKAMAVNSEQYLQKEDRVPVDERFFYKYFKMKADKTTKREDDDSEAESVDDDEFDEFLAGHEEGFDGKDDFEMDFAGELAKQKATKKNKKKEDEESEEESDDDLDMSDEDIEFSDDDDLKAQFAGEFDDDMDGDDFDEEDVEFSSDNEFADLDRLVSKGSKRKDESLFDGDSDDDFAELSAKPSKRKKESTENLFAAAEEFAHLIDDNAGSKFDMSGSNAVSNKDKADVKQLKWEANRDRWVRDKDWKSKRSKGKPKNKSGKRK